MIDTSSLLLAERRFLSVPLRQFTIWLNDVLERRLASPFCFGEGIIRKLPEARYDEEPLPSVREPQVVWRDQPRPTTRDMLGATNSVSERRELLTNHPPCPPTIEALEVTNVFKNDVRRAVFLKNPDDLVEERAAGPVACATPISGLRERLTGKAGTQNVVRWHLIDAFSNVAMDHAVGVWKVFEVKLTQLPVDFRSEDAFVAETVQRTMKTSESRKKIDKPQSGQSASASSAGQARR